MFGDNNRGRRSGGNDRKSDIKDFQDELKNKELDKTNNGEVFNEYKSLRSSVNTGLSRLYEDIEKVRSNIEEAEDQEQYKDRGFIREKTYDLREDLCKLYERVIEWIILDRETQWILNQKQYELNQRIAGEQASKEALKQMKEVFDQKFDADEQKMEIVKNTINEYQKQYEKRIDSEIKELEKRQDKIQNQFVDNYNDQVQTLNQTIRELKNVAEISSDNIKELEELQTVENVDEVASEPQREEVGQEFKDKIDQKIEEETEDPKMEEPMEEAESIEAVEPSEDDEEIEVPDKWNVEGSSTELHTHIPENPRYGYTQRIRPKNYPDTVMQREWMVLHALDSGCETRDEIQDYCDNHFNGFPNSQVRKLEKEGLIEKEELPDKIAEMI